MGIWNLGSVQTEVSKLVPDIPTSLSGTEMLPLADRKREYVENFVGTTIGSNAIDIKYQDIISNLTAAEITHSMMLTGADAKRIKLGDLDVDKGQGSNLQIAGQYFEEKAMRQLKAFGRNVTFKRTL